MNNLIKLLLGFGVLASGSLFAQRTMLVGAEEFEMMVDTNSTPGLKQNPSSVYPYIATRKSVKKTDHSLLRRKLTDEHTIQVDTGEFFLAIDPVFNLQAGRQSTEFGDPPSPYTNTRGFNIQANITERVGLISSFYENQSVFPDYLQSYVERSGVVPGQGRVKVFKDGYDYAMASGSFYYQVSDNVQLLAGHGKHHIGDGYRSLFLSTNAFNYPYFRVNLSFLDERLNYTQLYAVFQNLYRLPISDDTEPLFLRKSANIHYLSWNFSEKLSLGFMESTIFRSMDSLGNSTFYAQQLNPLPGANALSYGLDHRHNTVIGLNGKWQPLDELKVYGQLLWDNNQLDRNAIQFGAQFQKKQWVSLLAEYNYVAPKFYGNIDQITVHSHYNQYLAHPTENSFREFLVMSKLKYKRCFAILKVNYLDYLQVAPDVLDIPRNYSTTSVTFTEGAMGFLINPVNGMNVRLGFLNRRSDNRASPQESVVYLAFRTYISNGLYDF